METTEKQPKLTSQQQRIIKLLFKFRFVTARLLAQVLGIRTDSTYTVLEYLVSTGLVVKVYDESYRIDRKPAYYYLTKPGVTCVKNLLDVKEAVVHTLYKNNEVTEAFIKLCLDILACYTPIKQHLPEATNIFTKAEINRFKQFPKSRPDLYIRTPDGREAIIVFAHDCQPYIVKRRLDEILTHSEDEGWDGDYPCIAFVLRDANAKNSFLYKTRKVLENMGIDEEDLTLFATTIKAAAGDENYVWFSAFNPRKPVLLFG